MQKLLRYERESVRRPRPLPYRVPIKDRSAPKALIDVAKIAGKSYMLEPAEECPCSHPSARPLALLEELCSRVATVSSSTRETYAIIGSRRPMAHLSFMPLLAFMRETWTVRSPSPRSGIESGTSHARSRRSRATVR